MNMKTILLIVGGLIVVIVVIVVIRTLVFRSKQEGNVQRVDISLDKDALAKHLSGAIQYKTISNDDPSKIDKTQFFALHGYLEKTFPMVHKTLKREKISEMSLLYTWEGSDKELKPVIILAHQDTVPVEEEAEWTQPPYSGAVVDGYIWGRGTLDMKGTLIGVMEAFEYLINKGFKPKRTIYLAMGHDEEDGGMNGAFKIASLLKSRGIKFAAAIDEGAYVIEQMFPGLEKPVALIGIAEKGYLTIDLKVQGEGGHSAMPPKQTTISILAAAIHKLEQNPFPADLKGVARQTLECVGAELRFCKKVFYANIWLFKPLIKRRMAKVPSYNALLRTVFSATMIKGGIAENVLPSQASATVNFRIITGETTESVVKHVRDTINDSRVQITLREKGERNPSSVSDITDKVCLSIQNSIKEIYPDVVVAPYLVLAFTDSWHCRELSDQIYRFAPFKMAPGDSERVHGKDERVSVDNLRDGVKFYIQLIRNI
jgi:carboxypeptidase PM20D1